MHLLLEKFNFSGLLIFLMKVVYIGVTLCHSVWALGTYC